MKILVLLEFTPGTGARKRTAFNRSMLDSGFTRLPGVATAWVADRKFPDISTAEEAVADASTTAGAAVHKAYVVEYGRFAAYSTARQTR
jgi:hypothetical protein